MVCRAVCKAVKSCLGREGAAQCRTATPERLCVEPSVRARSSKKKLLVPSARSSEVSVSGVKL